MEPSEAVKQVLQMIQDGELTVEEVRKNAVEFSQSSNPFAIVVGEVYTKALPFLPQKEQAQE